jgi:type IV pilus assembly protein PilQ
MITRSKKLFLASTVTLFLVAIFSGCAQNRANLKEGETVVKNGAATIQSVTTAKDGTSVEVQTDRPLSYTYYKTSDPPKLVIDLAQTEPGTIEKSMELNVGNIKRIDITKHEFTGGFLSRIELILNKDDNDITVASDQVDKGKLLVTLGKPADNGNPAATTADEVKPVTATDTAPAATAASGAAVTKNSNDNGGTAAASPQPQVQADIKNDKPSEEKTQTLQGADKAQETVVDKPQQSSQVKLLQSISADSEGIQLSISGGIDKFNSFKLNKPDRIVLDLPGVKSGLSGKSFAINKFNVTQARQGIYPDKIRIVFDTAKSPLPPFKIEKNVEGLKIFLLTDQLAASSAPKTETVVEPARKAAAESKAVGTKKPAIESIDFKIENDTSIISIKTVGKCEKATPGKVSGGLTLTVRNCQIPARLQRMIDTSAFPSVVKMITPYQVKMKKGEDARIMAKLRMPTTSEIRQDGDTIIWAIKNPESTKSAEAITKQNADSETPKIIETKPVENGEKAGKTAMAVTSQNKKQYQEKKPFEKKVYTGRRVSLEFTDADIRKILQLIAEVSNLNFLIGDDVSGTISIKLVNVPWDQALDVILDSKGLEKKQDGNIMYIKPKGRFKTDLEEEAEAKKALERGMALKTKVFDINFANGSDVATKLFEKMRSDRGTITFDERTNRIIVSDTEERLEKMANILKEIDIPEKQVMIEARIVEAGSTFARDLGVQWGIHYRDDTASWLGIRQLDTGFGGIVTPPPTSGTTGTVGGNALGITFGTLASDVSVSLRISAAETTGQVKVISAPKVLTLNNKAAKITQGQNIPYATVSAEGTKTEWVEAALTLEVTPHVAADGTISMKIKASNDSPGQPVAGSTTPPINKKEATTEVQVKNGETTVIGGIYTDSDLDSDNGTPFLKDIPLLGHLFKSTSKNKQKTELLIFITPRLVN